MVAADAVKAVPSTIAAESEIFVLVNIVISPANATADAAIHRRRLRIAWFIPGSRRLTPVVDNVRINID